jgi:hypothetical protein
VSHVIEVDQSGKIERTQENTVLAFSNGIGSSVLILAVEKRECVRRLRQRGETGKTLYLKLFAAGLFVLFEDHLDQIESITIDVEYPGKEAAIRSMLLNHIRKRIPAFPGERIVFRRIGKKSQAHHHALAVYRGLEQPIRTVRARELLRLLQ